MSLLVTSQEVEDCVRYWLEREGGYTIDNPPRSHGETGADIIASCGDEKLAIEVIGFKSNPPVRAKDFFEAFFRAISRINNGVTKCAIALPDRFKNGMSQKVGHYGVGWDRIGSAFPELELWFVDTATGVLLQTRWSDWSTGKPNPFEK